MREKGSPTTSRTATDDVVWSRREALRTPAFWLIVITFGVAHVGVTGLNLHVFSFVSDQGHPAMVAAFVMSTIAFMQFSTPMVWGLLAERRNLGKLIMAKFLIQAVGFHGPCRTRGGSFSLRRLFSIRYRDGWNLHPGGNDLGQLLRTHLLGTIRGMGSLLTSIILRRRTAFFGILFDYTQSYYLSFSIFIGMLFASALLSLFLRPPKK